MTWAIEAELADAAFVIQLKNGNEFVTGRHWEEGTQVMFDVYGGVQLTLLSERRYARRLTLEAACHAFWRASTDDGIYTVGGAVGRTGGSSRAIAREIDLLLNWQLGRHTAAQVGYSHVLADDFISETGPDEDIGFLYATLQFTF